MGQAIRDVKPATPLKVPELIEHLQALAHVEIDATYAYETAIGKLRDDEFCDLLVRFRDEHAAHVVDVSSLIYGYGGKAPKPVRDWKGFLLEGAMRLRSVSGTEDAVKALRLVETLALRFYNDLLKFGIPADLRVLLERHRDANQTHLNTFEKRLEWLAQAHTLPPTTPSVSAEPH